MNPQQAKPKLLRLKPESALSVLAKRLGLRFIEIQPGMIQPAFFEMLPVELAAKFGVAPVGFTGNILTIAISDPLNLELDSKLVDAVSCEIDIVVAEANQITEALRQSESSKKILSNVGQEFSAQVVREGREGEEQVIDLQTIQGQSGIVRLTNSILMAGMEKQVSDIHLESQETGLEVKYRIDGVLYPAMEQIDVQHRSELISRIKILADLDIAEQRIPQDGRFKLRFENRDVDFRVSVLPTPFGEDVVIRILDKAAVARFGTSLTLDDLGLGDKDIEVLRKSAREPYGLVLVTGPTGSGKTTTLYSILSELSTGEEKIITVEDPIEYRLPGIVQVAVNEKKKLTFASGLRSILRHDPDKIMIGEIRDINTAEIAIQAALTGHLVFASVHANTAFDVISRFTHWGVDRHDFVTSLNSIVAQRLLRLNCRHCLDDQLISVAELEGSGLPISKINEANWKYGKGCPSCNGTGYSGRVGVMEHLKVSAEMAELLVRRASLTELKQVASTQSMRTIRQAALELAIAGRTTLAEVNRVTFSEQA